MFAEGVCISAFILELSRALAGNTLSWAYVFEWPILGGYAVFMWRKLLHDDSARPLRHTSQADDDALAAFNEYLLKVHSDEQRGDTLP